MAAFRLALAGKPVEYGEAARAQAHLLRARTDAILVGRKTVETDDPELTCRFPAWKTARQSAWYWRRAAAFQRRHACFSASSRPWALE